MSDHKFVILVDRSCFLPFHRAAYLHSKGSKERGNWVLVSSNPFNFKCITWLKPGLLRLV